MKESKESEERDDQWIAPTHLTSWREAIAANTKDKVLVDVNCDRLGVSHGGGGARSAERSGEWSLCGINSTQRASLLSQATFSLVLGSRSGTVGPETYTRLVEALRYGAIPVLLGVKHLPLESVIDWTRAAVILPSSSLGQLHFVLRNIDTNSVLRYRRQGRFLWDTYLHSPLRIVESAVAVVRWRALHPPPAAPQYTAATTLATITSHTPLISSPEFIHNFTSYSADFWNTPPGPFSMYPTTPFKPTPVSGSQYVGLSDRQIDYLPQHVVDAGGITGPYFEDYLLGNDPEEQFTIVMLTYERNEVLLDALNRLHDLDHLAKIVVVWNNPGPPPEDFKWPKIDIAIDVRFMCVACVIIMIGQHV